MNLRRANKISLTNAHGTTIFTRGAIGDSSSSRTTMCRCAKIGATVGKDGEEVTKRRPWLFQPLVNDLGSRSNGAPLLAEATNGEDCIIILAAGVARTLAPSWETNEHLTIHAANHTIVTK